MQTFTFYIRDTRYKVPTIEFVTAPDDASARALAAERLTRSTHHIEIVVYDRDLLLFTMVKPDIPLEHPS